MQIVLDTNVIVSAFLAPDGKPAAILRLVLRGDFTVCFDTAILAEYEEVLLREKFAGKIHRQAVQRFLALLYGMGSDIISLPSTISLPDEADRKFYDRAKTAGAALVTGNKKHFPDEPFIMTPTQFLESLEK
jgi:putative PIN family toxin of toxin-antitoxin system